MNSLLTISFLKIISSLTLRREIQRTFLHPHMAFALRAQELCSTITDIHRLEIKA